MGLFGKKAKDLDVTTIRKNMRHKVVCAGSERGDLVIALAKICAGLGLKPIILDNSRTHDVYEIFADGSDCRCIQRGLITVVRNGREPEEELGRLGYDIIITYCGLNIPDYISDDTVSILAFGPDRPSLEAAVKAQEVAKRTIRHVIYRYGDSSLSINDICHEFKITDKSQISVIKYNKKEILNYSRYSRDLTWPLIANLKPSVPVLTAIAKEILPVKDAELAKAARKGDVI